MCSTWPKYTYIFRSNTFQRNLYHLVKFGREYHNWHGSRLTYSMKNNILCRKASVCNVQHIHATIQNEFDEEKKEMSALWPDIVSKLPEYGLFDDSVQWMKKVFQYNVPNGKQNRAYTVITTYKNLAAKNELTVENMKLIRILAWCVEFIQGFYLVIDDITDHGKIRRGQPCWYLHNNIDVAAVNDGILIEQATYRLLKMYFGEKSYYTDMVQLFHDVNFKTALGESLDLLSTNFGKKPNLKLFSMDRYNAIVKYKAAYYTFILPVRLAMIVAGNTNSEMVRQADDILFDMGHFYQVQDDFLDCYGNPKVTQKASTDIQEGKCSWMVVKALQLATPKQRKIIEDCYGVKDQEKCDRVKQVYEELDLKSIYFTYEEEICSSIKNRIQQTSSDFPREAFNNLITRIYRRKS